jgi:hypothetical protein
MVGLNGIVIFLAKSCLMSIFASHLCYVISFTPFFNIPSLLEGSATKKYLMIDLAYLSISLGKRTFPFNIFW